MGVAGATTDLSCRWPLAGTRGTRPRGCTYHKEGPPGSCPALRSCGGHFLQLAAPGRDRGTATRGPAQSVQSKETKDGDQQATSPPQSGVWASQICSRPPLPQAGSGAPPAPRSQGHLGWPAVSTCPTLVSPVASGSWAWWGNSCSSVSRAGFAERGAHPCSSHIPGELVTPGPGVSRTPSLSVNLKQVREGKPQKGEVRSKGPLSKSTRDL